MRITSIDIETTGIKSETSQVLQIGAVVFETTSETFKPLGTYNKVIFHKEIHGNPFAIQMNAEIIKKIAIIGESYYDNVKKYYDVIASVGKPEYDKNIATWLHNDIKEKETIGMPPEMIAEDFYQFLITHEAYYIDETFQKRHFNVTGKNFWGFDNNFLVKLPNWKLFFHRRSFDPANLYYNPNDIVLPSLAECKKRCMEMLQNEESEELRNLFTSSEVTHDALDDAMDVAKLVWYKVRLRS